MCLHNVLHVGLNPFSKQLVYLVIGSRLLPYLLPPMIRGCVMTASCLQRELLPVLWSFILGTWTVVLGLEREMSVAECFYLHLLQCLLLYFCTGFVCEPRVDKTQDEDPFVSPPLKPPRPWRCC